VQHRRRKEKKGSIYYDGSREDCQVMSDEELFAMYDNDLKQLRQKRYDALEEIYDIDRQIIDIQGRCLDVMEMRRRERREQTEKRLTA